MGNESFENYTLYLQQTSRLGNIYRRHLLFPRLCKHLIGRTLDIGCGVGELLAYRSRTVGIDINPHNIEICKQRGLEAQVIENGRYPADDATFDSAIANHVIEHLPDPGPLLSEAYRVLKTGGILMLGVPGVKGFNSDPDHKVYYDLEKLTNCVVAHGFSVSDHFYMPLPVLVLTGYLRQFSLYLICKKTAKPAH
ncbi:MAG: hypothetical protein RIQ81_611 [Pseudomonadota bacterium]|jgi:SAM-dependent methyltransferase